jgi:hypothetical protein
MADINLAVIPDCWGLNDYGTPVINFVDNQVVHTPGKSSLRLERHTNLDKNTNREIDGKWYNCKPGDHIKVWVWVKTGPSGMNPDPSQYAGGRIGMDFYGNTSAGYGILHKTANADSQAGFPGWYDNPTGAIGGKWRVPWNTDWALIGWDIVIPADFYPFVNRSGAQVACTPHQVDSFVVWLDARSQSNPGLVWFADAELYINPTTPTPTPPAQAGISTFFRDYIAAWGSWATDWLDKWEKAHPEAT